MSLLGETVKVRREELRIGQESLAASLGVSQQTVSRWEKGLAIPRPARVVDLADVLQLDSAHLHRLAGYLPAAERSAMSAQFQQIYAAMASLSRSELLLLMDRVWQEIRDREGLAPPGTSLPSAQPPCRW